MEINIITGVNKFKDVCMHLHALTVIHNNILKTSDAKARRPQFSHSTDE